MPIDYTKPIVHGTVIDRRIRWRRKGTRKAYLVRLDDGREVWYWEDELDYEDEAKRESKP